MEAARIFPSTDTYTQDSSAVCLHGHGEARAGTKFIDLPVRLSSPASTAASPTRLDRAKPGWVACALARS